MNDIVERLRKEHSCPPYYGVPKIQAEAADEIVRLRAALELYREAVRIDVTMEGSRFMGSNASALKRAWDADRAALETPTASAAEDAP